MSTIQKDHWNPVLYDEQHSFVSKFGSSLIDYLAPKKGGKHSRCWLWFRRFSSKIANTGASVIGIDLSENMIAKEKRNILT